MCQVIIESLTTAATSHHLFFFFFKRADWSFTTIETFLRGRAALEAEIISVVVRAPQKYHSFYET